MRQGVSGIFGFIFGLLLATSCALAQPATTSHTPQDPFPKAAAAYFVHLDSSGSAAIPPAPLQPLWAHQATRHLPPASLTKLMMALLVVEATQPQDALTVATSATHETGTRLGLRQGERYPVEAVLGAALLESANDACHALANHVAGDEPRFVARMNQRAQALGLRDTHFTNACGHDDDAHYSSAYDLAQLAQLAMQQARIRVLVSQPEQDIATLDQGRRFKLKNRNALIGRYPGANGIKTGYTPKAGKCLIASATRGSHRVWLVLLNAPNRWWDATDMLDLAFAHATQ